MIANNFSQHSGGKFCNIALIAECLSRLRSGVPVFAEFTCQLLRQVRQKCRGMLTRKRTAAKAAASMVCGILFFFGPVALAAIILGHLALSESKHSAGGLAGRGKAIAGLVLGYAELGIIPELIIAAIAIPNPLPSRMAVNASECRR
jgi:hypothetical protein